MSREFDPYHKWLGISPREQPPHHYRLLAIDLFEDDPEVIDSAANRQMSYLQELASGPNVRHAQNLLNEISAARVCLLDKQRKADYDAKLKAEVAASSPPPSAPPSAPPASRAPRESKTPLPPRPSAQPPASPPPRDRGPVVDTGLGPAIAIDTRAVAAAARADTQRGSKAVARPKSKNNVPIIVSAVLLVVLICSGIVFAVVIASNSDDGGLAQQSPDSDGPSTKLDRREENDRAPRQSPLHDVTPSPIPSSSSDIPEPGANIEKPARQSNADNGNTTIDNDPATPALPEQPEVKPVDPRPEDPAPIDPPPAGSPELLNKAYEALQRRDIPQVIAHLEKCISDNPPSPYKEEVEGLLAQARVAISPEEAKTSLVEWLNRQTDEQVQLMANTGQMRIDINRFRIPVENKILKEVFLKTAFGLVQTPEWGKLVYARLNPADPQVAAADPPAPNDVKDPEPSDDKPDPPAPAPRPTDPAELLAAEGLVKEGGRWALAELEQELKDQLTKVAALEKKALTARNAVSSRQRAEIVAAQKALAQRQAAVEKEYQDAIFDGNKILTSDKEKIDKKLKAIAEFEKQVNAALEKVTQANIAAEEVIEELRPELDLLEEKVQSFEDTYNRLASDDEVLQAIEKQGGGSFAALTVLKSAQRKAAAIRKALDDGSL